MLGLFSSEEKLKRLNKKGKLKGEIGNIMVTIEKTYKQSTPTRSTTSRILKLKHSRSPRHWQNRLSAGQKRKSYANLPTKTAAVITTKTATARLRVDQSIQERAEKRRRHAIATKIRTGMMRTTPWRRPRWMD